MATTAKMEMILEKPMLTQFAAADMQPIGPAQ